MQYLPVGGAVLAILLLIQELLFLQVLQATNTGEPVSQLNQSQRQLEAHPLATSSSSPCVVI